MEPGQQSEVRHDPLTIAAIAILACALTNLLHEGVGHGVACVMVGVKPLCLSSIRLDWNYKGVSPFAGRIIAASGTVVNFLASIVFAWLLRTVRKASPQTRYFCWLMMSLNLLLGASYLFFTFAPFSDWYWFLQGLPFPRLWQFGLLLIGFVLYVPVAYPLIKNGLLMFVDTADGQARRQAGLLAWLPYAVCGMVATAAALLYRGSSVTGMAIGQWFGGASLLFYLPFFIKNGASVHEGASCAVTRDWKWIVAGSVTLLLFVFLLGPGIRF